VLGAGPRHIGRGGGKWDVNGGVPAALWETAPASRSVKPIVDGACGTVNYRSGGTRSTMRLLVEGRFCNRASGGPWYPTRAYAK
jgi:hypothetical protein